MDKIWDRKSFKVIGLCGGDEKTNDHADPTKSRMSAYIQDNDLGIVLLNHLCKIKPMHKLQSCIKSKPGI